MRNIIKLVFILILFSSCKNDDEIIYTKYAEYGNKTSEDEILELNKYILNHHPSIKSDTLHKNFYKIDKYKGLDIIHPTDKDTVLVKYTKEIIKNGVADGVIFDETIYKFKDKKFENLDIPVLLIVGGTNIFDGMKIGLKKMVVGEKSSFVFSSNYGFKDNLNIFEIAKHTSLKYTIELVGIGGKSIAAYGDTIITKYISEHDIKEKFSKISSDLFVDVVKKGDGNIIKRGENISINYTAKYLNGPSFNFLDDIRNGLNYSVIYYSNNLPQNFNECLSMITRGGKIRAYVSTEKSSKIINNYIHNNPIYYEISIN